MSQNINGQRIEYETFKSEFDANPELQGLVLKFDGKGLTVKTKEKTMPAQGQEKTGQVDSMAKRAAAKVINR